mmetsp:Transcript_81420/g.211678  ORF Transcript_81420/g.211678 Transcript_81420/m.211678 type:complete len:96 (-) Transcript_81420:279-566(-)
MGATMLTIIMSVAMSLRSLALILSLGDVGCIHGANIGAIALITNFERRASTIRSIVVFLYGFAFTFSLGDAKGFHGANNGATVLIIIAGFRSGAL